MSSWPCAETEPRGGSEMPALLKRMLSFDSFAVKVSTAGLMVVRSSRLSGRKMSSPDEDGERDLIFEMADCAFVSERPAT